MKNPVKIKVRNLDEVDQLPSPRQSWEEMNTAIRNLTPNTTIDLTCPPGYDMKKFRSRISVTGGRIWSETKWKLSILTIDRMVRARLIEREK